VSHPDGLPDLFLDRSLGRIKVPQLLRAAGLRLVTLSEHYGIPADEDVADDEWLELAGRRGWVVFMEGHQNPVQQSRARGGQGHWCSLLLPGEPEPDRR
jgi:hypothetical protein